MNAPPPDAPTGPQLAAHPRDTAVQNAAAELVPWLTDWRARHGLTGAEYLYLLSVLSGRHIQAVCVAEREGLGATPPAGRT